MGIENFENFNNEKLPEEIENNMTKESQIDKQEKGEVSEKTEETIDVDKIIEEIEEKLEQEQEEIEKELENKSPEEREKIGVSFKNLGFFVQEQKSKAMAWICEQAVSGGEKVQEQGTTKRWLAGWAESYRKDEELARKNIEEREKSAGIIKRTQNIGYLSGNILKYGRTVADVVGWTAGSPLRYAMMGAQFFARGAEAAKEARLMNEEVIDKTRLDINEAADEAYKIYEMAQMKAKEKGEKVSKENLEKAYAENLPKDLLSRLEKSEPGTAAGILQYVLKKDLVWAIKHGRVNEQRLKEYDKMTSRYGTVDALALGAKYAETAGKAAVAGVSIETAALGAQALWNNLPKMMHYLMEFGVPEASAEELPEGIVPKQEMTIPQELEIADNKASEGIEYLGNKDVPNQKLVGDLESAIIGKGEGIEHAFIRQFIDNKEEFGFKSSLPDDAAEGAKINEIKKWAGNEAHRLAIKTGYVDLKTGNEIRIGAKGIDSVAYVLEKDSDGDIAVQEYQKGNEGVFTEIEKHEAAKDFKSAEFEKDKEAYEYEYKKPEVKPEEIIPAEEPTEAEPTEAEPIKEETLKKEKLAEIESEPVSSEKPMFEVRGEDGRLIYYDSPEKALDTRINPAIEKLSQQMLNNELHEIYSSGFWPFKGPDQIEHFMAVKDVSASEVLTASPANKSVFSFTDEGSVRQNIRLQNFLKKFSEAGLPPDGNETVEQYINRGLQSIKGSSKELDFWLDERQRAAWVIDNSRLEKK